MKKQSEKVNFPLRYLIVFILTTGAQLVRSETPCSNDLKNGRFQKILNQADKAHPGELAWARFYLVSDQGTYEQARIAHEAGSILGTFVMLKCHRKGIGVKKDDRLKHRLNFDVRTRLEKIKKPNPIEHYMLAFLLPGIELGIVAWNAPLDSRWFRLSASANGGFAQAMDEIGTAMKQHDKQKAFEWHQKAANAGHASGMKNVGLFYLMNHKLADAVEWTEKAAQAGDVGAMINMAGLYHNKVGGKIDREKAQAWINRAANSSHTNGYLEKGLALLQGNYDFDINQKAGISLLQKAVQTGDAVSLAQLSALYARGLGLEHNQAKAVEFAEAAFRQGDLSAAKRLAVWYASMASSDPSLKEKAAYWKSRAQGGSAASMLKLDQQHPEIVNGIQSIDPYSLKVD